MSLHSEMIDWLEKAPRATHGPWTEADAIPTEYQGITYRSMLESAWARTLVHYGITPMEYETESFRLASGQGYTPDFRLIGLRTWIEVKGPHMHRVDKTREFAREQGPAVIVLLGFPALQRYLGPGTRPASMQWLDALGYDTRFTQCTECEAWQWLRPQLSRQCRRCNSPCTGLLALPGEMEFTPAQDEPYNSVSWEPFALCHGSGLTIHSTLTPKCSRQGMRR